MSTHGCPWPGCGLPVNDSLWGCKPHWTRLPNHIKRAIWRSWRPGQDLGTATPEYLEAYKAAMAWIEQARAQKEPS